MAKEIVIEYPLEGGVALVEGKVIPIGAKQITPGEILGQLKDIVSYPYMGRDVDKIGMTLIEAALYAAAKKAADGDTDALEKLLNRLMGKPVQQVANLNMTTTLKEFLDGLSRADEVDPLAD